MTKINSDLKAAGLLTALVLLTSLPFVGRAYFVDDYYFVAMAKGILQRPFRPYDFVSDDAGPQNKGWEPGQKPRMVNPPLFHYFLAGAIALFGDTPWKLRVFGLIFPIVSVCCTYFLGKRFVDHPLAATSLLAITPAFWLTSLSLLIDSALLAFFLTSLLFFMKGHEQRSLPLLFLSGICMGLTLLTKYSGALIVPLAFIWQCVERKRLRWLQSYVVYLLCVGILFLWGLWTFATYGQMHFLATFTRGFHAATWKGLVALGFVGVGFFWTVQGRINETWRPWIYLPFFLAFLLVVWEFGKTSSLPSWMETFYLDKALVLGSFLGGSTVFLWISPLLLGSRSKIGFGLVLAIAILLYFCFVSRYGGFNRMQSVLLAFFIGSTVAGLSLLGWRRPSDGDQTRHRFLLVWLTLGLLELITVMPWTAGRYLLLVLPPLCWLFCGLIQRFKRFKIWPFAWTLTACLGGLLMYADYAQANVIVRLAQILSQQSTVLERLSPSRSHRWCILGDTFSGYQPYLSPIGWTTAFPNQIFQTGDLLLRPRYRMSAWWTLPHPERLLPVHSYAFPSRFPFRVMDIPASAGFYASCWGSLPFVLTLHPLEQFDLYQVGSPVGSPGKRQYKN